MCATGEGFRSPGPSPEPPQVATCRNGRLIGKPPYKSVLAGCVTESEAAAAAVSDDPEGVLGFPSEGMVAPTESWWYDFSLDLDLAYLKKESQGRRKYGGFVVLGGFFGEVFSKGRESRCTVS